MFTRRSRPFLPVNEPKTAASTSSPQPHKDAIHDERAIKKALGFDPDDPNVMVRMIVPGEGDAPTDSFEEFVKGLFEPPHALPSAAPTQPEPGPQPVTGCLAPIAEALDRVDRARQPVLDILMEVMDEVKSAIAKHGPMTSPHEGHSVIREEFEELWEHVKADTGQSADARKEALQVAAMAVRYILDLDPR